MMPPEIYETVLIKKSALDKLSYVLRESDYESLSHMLEDMADQWIRADEEGKQLGNPKQHAELLAFELDAQKREGGTVSVLFQDKIQTFRLKYPEIAEEFNLTELD